jgi:hypothetical protein
MLLAMVGRPAAEADAFAEAQVGSRLGLFEAAQRVEEIHPLPEQSESFLTAKTSTGNDLRHGRGRKINLTDEIRGQK